MSASLTSEKLEEVIRESLEKNGRITTDYLKTALDQWNPKEKDLSDVVQLVNEAYYKNKDRKNPGFIVDDNTIKQIFSIIKPSKQSKARFSTPKRKSYPNRDNRFVPEMADTAKNRTALSFVIKQATSPT